MRLPPKKPVVMVDLPEPAIAGGPASSVNALINSPLSEVFDFKILRYKYNLGKSISLKRIFDLKQQIEAENPDIVHIAGLQLSGFHLAIAARLAKAPRLLMTIHGSSGDALFTIGWLKRWLMKYFFEPLTLMMVDRFYGVSEYVSNWKILEAFKRKKGNHIYNFPPILRNSGQVCHFRDEIGIGSDTILAVTVGRVTRDKGFHVLAEAIRLSDPSQDLIYCIVGDGDYLNEMKRGLQDLTREKRVIFLGDRKDIQDILSASDIFILPTLHETLSIALLEASVQGLPMVASETGGVPEIVLHGINGLLVPPGDPVVLAKAVRLLASDSSMRASFGLNARAHVDAAFNRQKIVAQVKTAYFDLLECV